MDFPPELLSRLPECKRAAAVAVLAQDPRPAYQEDPDRLYGLEFAGFDIRFTVSGGTLQVRQTEKSSNQGCRRSWERKATAFLLPCLQRRRRCDADGFISKVDVNRTKIMISDRWTVL